MDTKDAATVLLVLNGADITNTTGAAIYVANAEKVVITLAEGTQNYVADGASTSLKTPRPTNPTLRSLARTISRSTAAAH